MSQPAVSSSTAPEKLSTAELSKNYDQWMKIAADNKINTNNSWNVQLIDYFHDVSLMKEGDSINFQKASCTLDGCVKIYTSRVDSVASETSRLLSGLADNGPKNSGDCMDGDSDADDLDGRGNTLAAGKSKKISSRPTVNTIEKSEQALNVKKLDLEFSVDPLFKKTCADFDEGGASGLLLNHLHINCAGRIVFDASDVDAFSHSTGDRAEEENNLHSNEPFDIQPILDKFGDQLNTIGEKFICPSFRGFNFANARKYVESIRTGRAVSIDPSPATSIAGDPVPELDFSDQENNEAEAFDDFDVDLGNMDMVGFEEDEDDLNYDFNNQTESMPPAIPSPAAADLANQMESMQLNDHLPLKKQDGGGVVESQKRSQLLLSLANNDSAQNIYSYFDEASLKNWAGPQHWKVQRFSARRPQQQQQQQQQDNSKPKTSRQQFTIDFLDGETVDVEKLFAKDTKKSTLISAKNLKNADANAAKLLLPRDMHYSINDLTRLFMKPAMRISLTADTDSSPAADRIIFDGNTHLNTANNGGADVNDGYFDDDDFLGGGDDFGDDGASPHGFATQLDLHSQMNSTQFTQQLPGAGGGEDPISATQSQAALPSLKFVKSEAIHYEKRAKRVDVKKLKDNIWRDLTTSTAAAETAAPSASDAIQGQRQLSEVISHVRQMYPEQKAQDITPSFYFICLLHLANEKTLKIENSPDLRDLTIRQDRPVC